MLSGDVYAATPNPQDRIDLARKIGVDTLEYGEFIANGVWNVDDSLRPIYQQAGERLGREIAYPGDK